MAIAKYPGLVLDSEILALFCQQKNACPGLQLDEIQYLSALKDYLISNNVDGHEHILAECYAILHIIGLIRESKNGCKILYNDEMKKDYHKILKKVPSFFNEHFADVLISEDKCVKLKLLMPAKNSRLFERTKLVKKVPYIDAAYQCNKHRIISTTKHVENIKNENVCVENLKDLNIEYQEINTVLKRIKKENHCGNS
ncbi:MAG: hypothetical protein Q7T80_15910 [Methanoregula sp.]|nr:hypothetical protein [Methanoregula sp.]